MGPAGEGGRVLCPVGGDEGVDARIAKSQGAFWGLGAVLLACNTTTAVSIDLQSSHMYQSVALLAFKTPSLHSSVTCVHIKSCCKHE